MAVDRQGMAWVRYDDGSLWKVDTRDLSCVATTYPPGEENTPFYKFGMGFATTSAGANAESLYLSDNTGAGLAKLDLTTFKTFDIFSQQMDLGLQVFNLTNHFNPRDVITVVTSPRQ